MYRPPHLLIFVSMLCILLPAQEARKPSDRVDLPFAWGAGMKPVSVPSPDGKLVLRSNGLRKNIASELESEIDYIIDQNGRRLSPSIRMYISPYAMWSPSSDLLAITSSDGGLVGSWKTFVYDVAQNRVVEYNLMKEVQADMARQYPAGINPPGHDFFSDSDRARFARDVSWVNVLACRWLADPERLLVNVQIPPSSGYGVNMSTSVAYTIDPHSGRILHTYSKEESERLWKECEGD